MNTDEVRNRFEKAFRKIADIEKRLFDKGE